MALKPAHLQWSDDGTLKSGDFGDIYFQHKKGPEESDYVFLQHNRLPERFAQIKEGVFSVAELGFGTGLNFLLTAKLWQEKAPPAARLFYVSVEKHPLLLSDLKKAHAFWPELQPYAAALQNQYPFLVEGFHHLHFFDSRIHLMLIFGDVAEALPELTGSFDAWYLDGFSHLKNPEMWDEKLFPQIAARTKPQGTLATFSAAPPVLKNLEDAGFSVEVTKGFGIKRKMTAASFATAKTAPAQKRQRIAVLGAGVAGASAAFSLAQKGHAVTVIDRQPEAGAESSGNPVGIAYPKLTIDASPATDFHRHGFCYARGMVMALGLPSWNPCGVTHMDLTDEDEKRHRTLGQQGYPEDFLKYDGGLRLPCAGYFSPPELCRKLLDHPCITAVYSKNISSLDEYRDYDAIVIALGYGSKGFAETAWLPLNTLRGQITCLKPTAASREISGVICHEGYITPVVNGLHYIGATFQREEPATPEIRPEDHLENLAKLNVHLPQFGFGEKDIAGGRAGYRVTTPDKLPLIGPAPDYAAFLENFAGLRDGKEISDGKKYRDKIYIATALGAHGMSGSMIAGEIVACQIAGDPLPVPASLLDYLAPERFILRDLKRRKI